MWKIIIIVDTLLLIYWMLYNKKKTNKEVEEYCNDIRDSLLEDLKCNVTIMQSLIDKCEGFDGYDIENIKTILFNDLPSRYYVIDRINDTVDIEKYKERFKEDKTSNENKFIYLLENSIAINKELGDGGINK